MLAFCVDDVSFNRCRPETDHLRNQNQTRIESAQGAFLEADIPKGAKKVSVYFEVRSLPGGGPWVKCDESTTCNGVILPNLKYPGSDGDGSLHFSATVRPESSIGSKIAFTADTDVRLVTSYEMPGNVCVSQISFGVPSGSAAARWLFLPPNQNQSSLKAWIRKPLDNPWKLCDDTANHVTNACVPGGVAFDSAHQQDAVDQAKGMWFNCRNNFYSGQVHVNTEAKCRVQLEYKPQ